jgi:hypothetical protein
VGSRVEVAAVGRRVEAGTLTAFGRLRTMKMNAMMPASNPTKRIQTQAGVFLAGCAGGSGR